MLPSDLHAPVRQPVDQTIQTDAAGLAVAHRLPCARYQIRFAHAASANSPTESKSGGRFLAPSIASALRDGPRLRRRAAGPAARGPTACWIRAARIPDAAYARRRPC